MSESIASELAEPTDTGATSRRLLMLSLLIGLCGAALMATYMRRYELEQSGGAKVEVVSLVRKLERGALITEAVLSVASIPAAYVERRAVRASEHGKIVGLRTATALEPDDTLLWSDLSLSVEQRDLSSLVQPGRRAVAVQASDTSHEAGSGLIRPGDYVDVLATVREAQTGASSAASKAVVLLQRVLVLAVGSETDPSAIENNTDSRGGYRNGSQSRLTLSLRVEEAQLLALARERASISVALRNPDDARTTEGLPDLALDALFDHETREARVSAPAKNADLPVRISAAPKSRK